MQVLLFFMLIGVKSMRGTKWELSMADVDASVLAVSRECDGQPDNWFTKSSFIDRDSKLDKNKSGHVTKFE